MEADHGPHAAPIWVRRLERAFDLTLPAWWLSLWAWWAVVIVVLIFAGCFLLIVYAAPNASEVLRGVSVMVLSTAAGGYLLGGSLYAGGINKRFVREGRIIRVVSRVAVLVSLPLLPFTGIVVDLLSWMGFEVGFRIRLTAGLVASGVMTHYVYRAYQREKSEESRSL